jgi:hypothetical protein
MAHEPVENVEVTVGNRNRLARARQPSGKRVKFETVEAEARERRHAAIVASGGPATLCKLQVTLTRINVVSA